MRVVAAAIAAGFLIGIDWTGRAPALSPTPEPVAATAPAATAPAAAVARSQTTRVTAPVRPTRKRASSVPITTTDLSRLRSAKQPAPIRLQVRDVSIDMAVVPVGVTDTGEMALPESVQQAGWYRYGPGPGDDRGTR